MCVSLKGARKAQPLNLEVNFLASLPRELMSMRVQFEDHIQDDIEKLRHSLDIFYTVVNMEFSEKKGSTMY